MSFSVGTYRGERERFAVYHSPSGVWYFPKQYGRAAAERLARRLNAKAA